MGGDDEDAPFAQDASPSRRVAQQWELRVMAQEAASELMANSRLRRLLARNEPYSCADVRAGDSALFREAANRKKLAAIAWPGGDSVF